MALVNSNTVAGYMDLLGMGYAKLSDSLLITGFNLGATYYKASVPVEIRTGSNWVSFRGVLVGNLPVTNFNAVARYVCFINSQCWGIRYAIVESNVLVLAEIHISRLSKESFSETLAAIASSAIQTTIRLRVLSTSQGVAEGYLAAESLNSGTDTVFGAPPTDVEDVFLKFNLRPNGTEKLLKREVVKKHDAE